jgi:hypothetical protein
MPSYYDDAAELIRRLLRPAAKAGDMLDTAGDAGDLARVAPPRMQVELPVESAGLKARDRVDAGGWPVGTPAWASPSRSPSFDGLDDVASPPPVDLSLDSPSWGPLSRSADRFQQMRRGQSGNLRNQPLNAVAGQAIRDADAARQTQMALESSRGAAAKTAAGVGVAGAAGAAMLAGGGKKPEPATADITSTDGTAELANESRPAPVVAPDEESEKAFTEKFKRQYTERENKRQAQGAGTYPKPAADPRAEAERLMKDLNARRMAASGEVADGAATEARIRKLMEQSNQMRNSQTPQQMQAAAAAAPQDYHAQARAMLADLNDRDSRMGGTPPDMQKVLAEVRRLNALGDEQRNARTTARS